MANYPYDLEARTLKYAKSCIDLCNTISKNPVNIQLICQLTRSASSVGANYREANEAFSRKDFCYRIVICRKETKESRYWLELITFNNCVVKENVSQLLDESTQLIKIFSSIIKKSS